MVILGSSNTGFLWTECLWYVCGSYIGILFAAEPCLGTAIGDFGFTELLPPREGRDLEKCRFVNWGGTRHRVSVLLLPVDDFSRFRCSDAVYWGRPHHCCRTMGRLASRAYAVMAATRLCWPDFLLALSLALATHRIHENVRALPPRPPRAPHDSARGFRNNNRCDSLLEVCRSALSKRSRTTVANEAVRDCRCCRCGPRGDWSQCNSLTRSPRPVLDASKYYASYLKYEDKEAMRKGRCFLVPEHSWEDFNFVKCLSTDDMKKDYLLFGDSYAAHLWYGLSVIFREDNFLQATVAGCSPIFDRRGSGVCDHLLSYIFSDYLRHHKVDGLILAAHWSEQDVQALPRTLDWAAARGIPVILIGPLVQYDTALPRLLAFSVQEHNPAYADYHRQDFRSMDEEIRQIAESRGIKYMSLYKALCDRGTCAVFAAPGIPLQFDDAHLTRDGSVLVARLLLELRMLPENSLRVWTHSQ